MTIVFPEAIKQQGNTAVTVVQTIADTDSPGLAAEINAASSVNISCYLYTGGEGTATTNTGEAPRRLCSTKVLQQYGTTTYSITDLQYVYDPQADDADPANAAKAALTEGSEVFLVIRKGLPAETTAFAAAQKVDVWRVRLGPQNRTRTGDGEFDEFSITQSVVALAPPTEDAVIAA